MGTIETAKVIFVNMAYQTVLYTITFAKIFARQKIDYCDYCFLYHLV